MGLREHGFVTSVSVIRFPFSVRYVYIYRRLYNTVYCYDVVAAAGPVRKLLHYSYDCYYSDWIVFIL